jgi:hypothetical protein
MTFAVLPRMWKHRSVKSPVLWTLWHKIPIFTSMEAPSTSTETFSHHLADLQDRGLIRGSTIQDAFPEPRRYQAEK